MFAVKDVSPEHASQRGAESCGESAVVHSNRHRVDGSPECALRDVCVVVLIDGEPSLDYAAEEDCCSYVCAGELKGC